MTIEALAMAQHEQQVELPPHVDRALTLLEEVEACPEFDVNLSPCEAALITKRTFEACPDIVEQAAGGLLPDSQDKNSLVRRAQSIIGSLLDEVFVLANEHLINRVAWRVKQHAADGDSHAMRALISTFEEDGEATGAWCISDVAEIRTGDRLAAYDKKVLEDAQDSPVKIDLEEAEIVLAAPVVELGKALEAGERTTIIELSEAVRLVIGHLRIQPQ